MILLKYVIIFIGTCGAVQDNMEDNEATTQISQELTVSNMDHINEDMQKFFYTPQELRRKYRGKTFKT